MVINAALQAAHGYGNRMHFLFHYQITSFYQIS